MDDSAEYRHVKRRRYITVALSVSLTTVMCVGYVVADIFDKLPGVLTLQEVEHATAKTPGNAIAAATMVGGLDASKTVDAVAAKALISQFETAASDFGGEYAIAIADAAGNVVAEQNLDTPYTPASTMKTLTAYAAAGHARHGVDVGDADLFGAARRWHFAIGAQRHGDMLLGVGESDSAHINGRAGLGTLAANTAQALRQRGITSVTLVYDDSLFGNDRWPNGIAELDPDHVYYAPTASMAVDGGRNWNGANPTDPDTFSTYPVLSTQPAREAALVFAQRLTERGIAVNGSVEQGAVPDGTSPIATVSSASLNEIMAFMLRHSDNSLAEEFGRLLALHLNAGNSPAGAVQSVEQVLAQRGISTEGLTMVNCSGLAEDSKLTAHTLLDVQQRNLTSGSGSAAAEGLSIVGFVGTAANRLNDADEAGLIRAKTGSLGDVTSMTGNVSRHNGGALSFAVIVNDPDDSEAAKSAIDTFVAALPKL